MSRRLVRILILAALAPVLGACFLLPGSERRAEETARLRPYLPPEADGEVEVLDSAGVRIVRNPAVGAWGPELASVELVVQIGELYSEEEYQFGWIDTIELGPDSSFLVGESREARLRVYARDGTYVRRLGRKGEGPGEMASITQTWIVGDTVHVLDPVQSRLTAFDWEGGLVDDWRLFGRQMPVHAGPNGWLARPSQGERAINLSSRPGAPIVLRAAGERPRVDTLTIDTLPEIRVLRAQPLLMARWTPGSDSLGATLFEIPARPRYVLDEDRSAVSPLFDLEPSWAFDREGHLHLRRVGGYRLAVFTADGRLERIVTRAYAPLPIEEGDIEELKDRVYEHTFEEVHTEGLEEGFPGWLVRPIARTAAAFEVGEIEERERAPHPEHAHPVARILVDPEGMVWAERADALSPGLAEFERALRFEERPWHATRWDIFAADGRFLGTAELPARFHARRVRGLEVSGVVYDEYDVQYVATYRVIPPASD